MGYDQVFKGILRRFFQDFMELFFPDVAESLDFASVELLDKELFKGFPDGVQRTPDFVVRVRTREGRPEMVIVHIEAQAGTGWRFGRRMFEYYSLLWLSYDIPVFPIVLFVKGGGRQGIATRTYRHEVLGREVMKFQFASVALAGFSGWEYLEKGPLAAALAPFMRWEEESDEAPGSRRCEESGSVERSRRRGDVLAHQLNRDVLSRSRGVAGAVPAADLERGVSKSAGSGDDLGRQAAAGGPRQGKRRGKRKPGSSRENGRR